MTNPNTPTIEPEGIVEATQTDSGAPQPDAAVSDIAENDQDADADDTKSSKLRHRAQQAETERDALTAVLDGQRREIVTAALTAAGFDSDRLRSAAAIDFESILGDDGLVDPGKLASAIEAAAEDLHVTPPSRRPRPNPLVGRGGGDQPTPDGLQQFREAFSR
jgi:hypothetical protein